MDHSVVCVDILGPTIDSIHSQVEVWLIYDTILYSGVDEART